jgi:hypothetical protein
MEETSSHRFFNNKKKRSLLPCWRVGKIGDEDSFVENSFPISAWLFLFPFTLGTLEDRRY